MLLKLYLSRRIAAATALVFAVTSLAVVSVLVTRQLHDVASGRLDYSLVATALLASLADLGSAIVPLAALLGASIVLARLRSSGETTALASLGVSPLQKALWLVPVAAGLTAVAAAISLLATPKADIEALNRLKDENLNYQLRRYQAGVPSRIDETLVWSAGRNDRGDLLNVLFLRPGEGGLQLVWADQLVMGEDGKAPVLLEAWGWNLVEGQRPVYMRFAKMLLPAALPEPPKAAYTARLHWQMAPPIMTFLLFYLAVAMAAFAVRKGVGSYTMTALGIFIYSAYFGALLWGRGAISSAFLPGWVGLWWVHLPTALLVLAFYRLGRSR